MANLERKRELELAEKQHQEESMMNLNIFNQLMDVFNKELENLRLEFYLE